MFLRFVPDWVSKIVEYTFYVFLATFPFIILKNFLYQGSSTRFLTISIVSAVLMIFVGFSLLRKKTEVHIFKSPILLAFVIYFSYLFFSAILGENFYTSFWSKIERTSGLFFLIHLSAFILILTHLFEKEKIKENILKVVAFSSALYSFLSMLGPQGFKIAFKNNPFDGFLFGNSSFAAMYLLGAFLMSIYLIFRKEKIKWFEFFVPLLIVFNPFFINFKIFSGGWQGISSFFGIAQASSLGIFTSILMLVVFLGINKIKKEKLKRWLNVAVVTFSVLIVTFITQSLLSSDGLVRKIYEKQSTLSRPVVWEISNEALMDKPLTGWGIDNFAVAFQENFDNRLLQQEYGEPWFDRAHNIILDQAVDTGCIGVTLYVLLYLILIYCVTSALLKAKDKETKVLSIILITYFIIHFLELQTAFDTVASYITLAIMLALSVTIVSSAGGGKEFKLNQNVKYGFGVLCVLFFSWSLFFGSIPFWKMQIANGQMRIVGTSDKRIPYYERVLSSKVDSAGVLWRISNDFQKGISENPTIIENPERSKKLLEELDLFTKEYEEYVSKNPNNFRMKINLADLYIYHLLFGVDMLDKADATLDEASKLVPNHPQPYVMKAVSHVYRNDFKNASMYVQKAEEINPNSIQVQRVKSYIEESEKTFPEIELFFFGQI